MKCSEKRHNEETEMFGSISRRRSPSRGIRDSSKPVGAYLSPAKGAGERPRSWEMVQKGGDNKGEDEQRKKKMEKKRHDEEMKRRKRKVEKGAKETRKPGN